jgi:hypothetical protein
MILLPCLENIVAVPRRLRLRDYEYVDGDRGEGSGSASSDDEALRAVRSESKAG